MIDTRRLRYARHVLRLALALLVLAGCAEMVETPVRITSFQYEEDESRPGLYRLTWAVSGLEDGRVILEPGINGQPSLDVTARTADGTGEIDVAPETTTTYTLTATNGADPSQSVSRSVEIEVEVPGAPDITAFRAEPSEVNPGLQAALSWSASGYDTLRLEGPGLGDGVDVSGQSSYTITPTAGADYTLTATNDVASVDATLQDVGRVVPATTFLVAGQSNAQGRNLPPAQAKDYIDALDGVRMLGNDYVWKEASEPLDDCTGQVDDVSRDPSEGCSGMGNSGVSFGVSLGNHVHRATGGVVFLIPAAKGGSSASQWRPGSDRYDRSTLFGSSAFRARLAAQERGAPLGYARAGNDYGAVAWFQGEADANSKQAADAYNARTDEIFDAYQAEFGAPIIFAQLPRRANDPGELHRNLLYQRVRHFQRELESASSDRYMVVTHDLPMSDTKHLSASAQVELGRRMALAFREHLLGEVVDGSGPRLIDWQLLEDGRTVRVDFDRAISAPSTTGPGAYSGYFDVFAGDTELDISTIVRGDGPAGENTAVLIMLENPAPGSVDVRYLPPEGILSSVAVDVVRTAQCTEPMPDLGLCLPAPAFGLADGGVALESLQFFDDESY